MKASLGAEFACIHNFDEEDLNNAEKWDRYILKKVRKYLWELLDETGTEHILEVSDLSQEWGRMYRSPPEEHI